jgi:hypothetical protein
MKNSTTLKTFTFCLCLFLLSVKTQAINKSNYDSLSILQVEGKISNLNENVYEDCIVELIWKNEVVQTLVLKEGKKKFKFILGKNTSYSIRISKKGYLSKLISVETEIPESEEYFGLYKFEFETSLIKEASASRLNKEMIDFPIAIVRFDYEQDIFSYDKKYTAHIKRELHKPSNNQRTEKETASASN